MKTFQFFVLLFLLLVGVTTTSQTAQAAEKLALPVNDTDTFFALPFTLSHSKYALLVPTSASRDGRASTSLGFTLKTPEGLRQNAGLAVGTVVKDKTPGTYVLYVLYRDTVPSARVNTLAISHLPFLLVSEKSGTISQSLNQNELRDFVVKNGAVKPLVDTE